MTEPTVATRSGRDQTWMTTTAALSAAALAVALIDNGGDGPDGLVFPLLVLPVVTFIAHALRRLPWPVLVTGVAVGPAIVFLLGYAEGSMFFLTLLSLVMAYDMANQRIAVAIAIAMAIVPVLGGGVLSLNDSGWAFWAFGIGLTFFFGRLGRENRDLVDKLNAQRAHVAEQAASEERQRIAREIHDLVGHSLTVVLLHISGARRALRRDPESAEQALASAEQIGRDSLAEIRRSVSLLRTDGAGDTRPSPSTIDIEDLVAERRDAGQSVTLVAEGPLHTADGTVGLTAYRIVQEALSNAAKHAPNAPVTVEVRVDDDRCTVLVENDLVPGSARTGDSGGFGIVGMRERVSAAKGNLVIGPAGRCWRVEVSLPIDRSPMMNPT